MKRHARYAVRRSNARLGLVALLLLTVALVVGALARTQTYLDVASARAVGAALDACTATDRVLQLQTRLRDDGAAQADGVATILDDLLPADRDVWHTLRTAPLGLRGTDARIVLLADGAPLADGAALTDDAQLVDGVWPATATDAALQADAAAALGLGVGQVLEVVAEDTAATLTVVGTWRPTDPAHPRWGGDTLAGGGADPLSEGTYGPLVVLPDARAGLDTTPFAQWTITPGPGIAPADLDRWISGLGSRGIVATGELRVTLEQINTGLASSAPRP